tara:strand:+ start:50 stop:478 length:429 start_codon:yes stop_codon:yes gene_type:complete
MSNFNYEIYEIEPEGLSGFRNLNPVDSALISKASVVKAFNPRNHFVELSYFTLNNVKLNTYSNYRDYSILSGNGIDLEEGNSEIAIDVQEDYLMRGFEGQEVKVLYNFLDYVYSDDFNPQDFYIDSISSDRREIRIVSTNLG